LYNQYLEQPGYCTGNGYAWARSWRGWVHFVKLLRDSDEKCNEGIGAYYDLLVAITIEPNIVALEWRCEVENIMAKHNVVVK